jgi:hypothetical protein
MLKLTLSKMEDVFSTIHTSATAIDALDLRVDALATTIATARGADMLQYLVNSSSNIEINNDAIITICNNGNNGTWSALGNGLNDIVTSLAVDSNNNVYVGGTFSTAGGQSALRIAKWNPAGSGTWSRLENSLDNAVISLAVDSNNNVYVGGYFTTAVGQPANCIAMWNPASSTWSTLGAGADLPVTSLAVDSNNNVYVGGYFSTAGDQTSNYIANLDKSIDITINNNYVTTLSDKQYQCGNYYKANNRFYKTFNGYL